MRVLSSSLWFLLITKSFGIYFQDGGCYQEYPINAGSNYSSHHNTADSCRHNCSAENFTYAAVHNGTQCFCHNQDPPVQNIRPRPFCNVSCPGHVNSLKKTICGGEHLFNTYRTLQESGCYSDPGPGNHTTLPEPWLLNNTSSKKNETALTIERCINYCSKQNFSFAGVQLSAWCYCGNHQPPISKLFTPESGTHMCNFPCTGNGIEMCGGLGTTNIYSTNKIIDEGCYYHRPYHWILNGAKKNLATSASLYNCQYFCSESDYKYAGIFSHFCFCGNNNPQIGQLRPFDVCNYTCPGDGRSECGGRLAIRIVNTLITGGCYPAINESIKIQEYNSANNSIDFCVNKCKAEKKFYAGIQNGSICSCFDDPPKLAHLSYGHCNETCPGNEDEICGGNNHMNVFRAQIEVCRTIEDGPNKNTPCKFPFFYKGVERQTCIRNKEEDRPYCGIKYNMTVNDWGICNENECPISLVDDDKNTTMWMPIWIVISVGITTSLCVVLGSIIYAIQMRKSSIAKINNLLLSDGRKPSLSLPWNNQVNMLSYDTKFEIDKEDILMQEKIGDGQFGTVHKGILKSGNGSKETEVAIKRVKDINDENQLTAIIGELKILSHIGNHLNLVNLIGACTKDDVCILLEFCPMCDLKNFITNNRSEFIFNMRNPGDIISSENYVESQSPLQSTLLLNWCHSIAKGMEYLESKNIMHGDLAIRNILLTKDYVAKIGDFGLSKEIFYGEEYMKKNRRLIPWAWMAIEYLQTGKFSLKSDVWSFGVVMWEIYTLGNKPYDMQPYEEVRPKLTDGYRLSEPDYMEQLDPSEDIYSGVIWPCWIENPVKRPNFRKIVSMLENKLAKKELDAYLKMKEHFELAHDVKTKHKAKVCNTEEDTFKRKGIETERTKLIESPYYRNYHGTFASTSGYTNKIMEEEDTCNDWKEFPISDQESSQEEEEVQEEEHNYDYFNIIIDDRNVISNEEFEEDSNHGKNGYGEYISLLDN